jgi:hypothetical protein
MVLSDDARLVPQLRALRAVGFAVIVVSSDRRVLDAGMAKMVGPGAGTLPGRLDARAGPGSADGSPEIRGPAIAAVADVILDWEAVKDGIYHT